MALGAMDICLQVLKESSKSRFDSYSVLIVSRISFWDCRVHIFSDNLSRNSCIHLKVPVFTSSRSIVYIQVTDHVFSTLMNLEGNAIFRLGNLGTWRPFAIVKNLLPGFYHIFYGPWIQEEKKNRFHMFKDQESNVNKLFHLLPTRKLSISNGEVAMLGGYFACIPRYCKIHLLL